MSFARLTDMKRNTSQCGRIKQLSTAGLSFLFLILTTTAHADFRKAVDAYVARDGDTLMKEVKDAVDKNKDDGLMLFLMATNMDAVTSDYDETTRQSKSTLRGILSSQKWDELRKLLVQATNDSSVDAQYYLNLKSQFSSDFVLKKLQLQHPHSDIINFKNQQWNEVYRDSLGEFKKNGSYGAYSDSQLSGDERIKFAELGDAFSQLVIGLQYHRYVGDFACDIHDVQNANSLCGKNDIAKGDYWLKKAVKSYEASVHDDSKILYESMCNFYKKTKGEEDLDAKNWCSLKSNQLATLPEWVIQARQELAHSDAPIIKAYFKDAIPEYELDIYKDGRVLVVYGSNLPVYKDIQYVISSPQKEISNFVNQLEKLKVSAWDTTSQFYGFPTDCNGDMTEFQVLINNQQKLTKYNLKTCYKKSISEPDFRSIQIAKLKTLLEKHFDVNSIRFKLGNSKEKINSRLSREEQWNALSKKEIKK